MESINSDAIIYNAIKKRKQEEELIARNKELEKRLIYEQQNNLVNKIERDKKIDNHESYKYNEKFVSLNNLNENSILKIIILILIVIIITMGFKLQELAIKSKMKNYFQIINPFNDFKQL